MVSGRRVTVTTSATALAEAGHEGAVVFVLNPSATTAILLGGADVTAGEGFQLEALTTLGPLHLGPDEALYGIVASGSQVCQVLAVPARRTPW